MSYVGGKPRTLRHLSCWCDHPLRRLGRFSAGFFIGGVVVRLRFGVKGLGCRIRLRFLSIHTADDINPALPIFVCHNSRSLASLR